MEHKGYLQVYTGNGKGKTTAALGLALRAAGAGLNVLFAQFVKGERYNEIEALERYKDRITVRQYGRDCFILRDADEKDIEAARNGLAEIRECLQKNIYQVVILDEGNIALHYKLFSTIELLETISMRNDDCEVIVTGRNAPQELIDMADLVTEMREVKHYYTKGVYARIGIER